MPLIIQIKHPMHLLQVYYKVDLNVRKFCGDLQKESKKSQLKADKTSIVCNAKVSSSQMVIPSQISIHRLLVDKLLFICLISDHSQKGSNDTYAGKVKNHFE